ncbi:hypothetical protein SacmaDRAFT_1989 [Saccharomonospora marina XMU15]|uniref:Uncharacterized protein n=1 Tax=Saccharomonospora marina XMU15 TaxID=882083 RepID=H5X8F0_9PSEU|nr:hypothetical protein [Saccharomonospora marina]EHR50246.1 hypothetical protein SacmaDRAFT_1989 [Saccharomonospora marina XMU15]
MSGNGSTAVLYDNATAELSVSLVPAQAELIERLLLCEGDPCTAAALLRAARQPHVATNEPGAAAIRALRPPAHVDLPAALLRIARAVDSETEALYRRKDSGDTGVLALLRSIALRLLELGFTVAEEGGIECRDIEEAIAQAYGFSAQRSGADI